MQGITVNFRVVGIYCYIPGLDFDALSASSGRPISPDSTIQEIQDAVKIYNNNNEGGNSKGHLEITDNDGTDVTAFEYRLFEDVSNPFAPRTQKTGQDFPPIDWARQVRSGTRKMEEHLSGRDNPEDSRVWQYYVSAYYNSTSDNSVIEVARSSIDRQSAGVEGAKPLFSDTPLIKFMPPKDSISGYELSSYNITWRLVGIQMTPDAIEAKYERRRQRTSGRIV